MRLTAQQRRLLSDLSDLSHCNPFEPTRIALEREVLGDRYRDEPVIAWSRTQSTDRHERPNVIAITRLAEDLAESLRVSQTSQGPLEGEDATLYDDLITYTLYYRHLASRPRELLASQEEIKKRWRRFRDDRELYLGPLDASARARLTSPEHLFACLHQVRRAFNGIFDCLIGESEPMNRLRAAVWQSIFTHDLRRYRRVLYARMTELSTLVVGPSGSGKELVARAIGRSQFRPFDPSSEGFLGDEESFIALNLSALSPTLIESELFGHRKGSFTGASSDHAGWFERCPVHGAVLLDEIGELDPAMQVKLLRVAQTRDYSRLGETTPRRFVGKLLAATNRDLADEMHAGRFREDLYYRLCSDRLVVPSLQEQLADQPEAISGLVRFLAERVLGDADPSEAETLAKEVEDWIAAQLPPSYGWPGNIRELEQCVRSVLVRRAYHPPAREGGDRSSWLCRAERGELSADELLDAYCELVHQQQGGYEQAARILGLDRRTVKARVSRSK